MGSIFGWDYPPGCSGTPFDDDFPCEVCGQWPDDCICPECDICGAPGDPLCYTRHGLRRTEEQKFLLEIAERQWKEEAQSIAQTEANMGDWRDDYID